MSELCKRALLIGVHTLLSLSTFSENLSSEVYLETGAILKIFLPQEMKNIGGAIIICPGGGYDHIAGDYEGAEWAPLINELGYTVAILSYRLPHGNPEIPLADGLAALRYLRKHANIYNINSNNIGVMGFSAGGHLASLMATHLGNERPAFQILFYPVITMENKYTHSNSRENLLGKNPSQELIDYYSNEKYVTSDTPQAYIFWADDDDIVDIHNSLNYMQALQDNNVVVYYKSFPTGGHGFGFKTTFIYHDDMVNTFSTWLYEISNMLSVIHNIADNRRWLNDGNWNNIKHYLIVNILPKGIYIRNGKKYIFCK